MRYMLLIYGDERVWSSLSEDDMRRIYADHIAYGAELTKAGVLVGGAELKPVATATSIRFSGGRTRTVDGPFAETKEQLGGYYVVDCKNLDEAIQWAAKIPHASISSVEVRPIVDFSQTASA